MLTGFKQALIPILILALSLQLTGCGSSGTVRLCDYKNIAIPAETVEVSQDDVLLSVQMQMTEKAPELEFDALTDEMAGTYFSADSAEAVYTDTRTEIAEHRAYDYAYSFLLNNSLLRSGNEAKSAYIRAHTEELEALSAKEDLSINAYLQKTSGVTFLEYMNGISSFYDEYLILEELLRQEGITVSEDDYRSHLQTLARESSMSAEQLQETYTREVVLYTLYQEISYDILLKYLTY